LAAKPGARTSCEVELVTPTIVKTNYVLRHSVLSQTDVRDTGLNLDPRNGFKRLFRRFLCRPTFFLWKIPLSPTFQDRAYSYPVSLVRITPSINRSGQYLLFLVALLLPVISWSQYKGGINDGVSSSISTSQNATPSIYFGGINDGTAFNSVSSQNQTPSIYKGGINDGVAFANVSNQNPLDNIYKGGVNDGVAFASITNQNSTPSIYLGGVNDGVASSLVTNQNPTDPIYRGGVNDGTAIASIFTANALPDIYKGGINDGYAFAVSLNQNPSNVLNVSLLDFTGSWFNDDAVLGWSSSIETGLNHYELERSEDGGTSFQKVADVDPDHNPNGPHDYRHVDVRAYYTPGDYLLYRLKSVDNGGIFKYSGIVRLMKDRTAPVFVAYPNPTSGHFTLAIMNVQDLRGYSYTLVGIDGKLVKQGVITQSSTLFDITDLSAASYRLILIKDGKSVQSFSIQLIQ